MNVVWPLAMPFLYNNPNRKNLRRSLRRTASPPEKLLWFELRQFRHQGFIFRRQYSVGTYILDFYCPRTRLAVEVDGSQHVFEPVISSDQKRDAYLRSNNIHALRITTTDVSTNVAGVLEAIWSWLVPPRGRRPSAPPIDRRGQGRGGKHKIARGHGSRQKN
jgi:very-short-patch-repair endonuclease